MPRKDWKTTEVRVIRENGGAMCASQLAELLPGRTPRAVTEFAWKNGLRVKTSRAGGWSDDEIVTMEAMAGTHTAEAIGRALGRTGRAVQSKAHDLGIPLKQYGQHHHMGTIPNEKREAYWAMVDGGMPKKHAALAVGVNPSTAQQWVRPVKRISE
jgi:hypothetical protein